MSGADLSQQLQMYGQPMARFNRPSAGRKATLAVEQVSPYSGIRKGCCHDSITKGVACPDAQPQHQMVAYVRTKLSEKGGVGR